MVTAGEAVRRGIETGKILHLDTGSEEITDEFQLFAINSGLLRRNKDSQVEQEISRERALNAHFLQAIQGLGRMPFLWMPQSGQREL